MDGIPDFIEQRDSKGTKYWVHKDFPDVAFTTRGRALTIQYKRECQSFYIQGIFDFSGFFPYMKALVDFVDIFGSPSGKDHCLICGEGIADRKFSPVYHFRTEHWKSLPGAKSAAKV